MFVWICGLALGARITVDAAGSGDFEDIQDAVDAASPGDHLVVLAGDYSAFTLSSALPILGLDGPDLTWVGVPSASVAVTLEGLSFELGSSYATLYGGSLRRVGLYGGTANYVVWNNANPLSVEGSILTGSRYGVYSVQVDVAFTNTTHVAPTYYAFYAYYADYEVQNVLLAEVGTATAYCSSGTVTIDHGLTDGNALGCASASSLLMGFDPGFQDRTSGTATWRDDDLTLASGSHAIGAGDCDGVACDLGSSGYAWSDEDLDGMPDDWEASWGLDSQVDDGALDEDGDGLENLAEYLYRTDPSDPDTDQDGVEDLEELQLGLDPLDSTDQGPTAVITSAGSTPVGEGLYLDGGSSSDPTGDPLTWTWTLVNRPSGSQLDTDLGDGSSVTLVPDVAGPYTVSLSVSDGVQSGSTTHGLVATQGGTVSIPGDFDTLASALPYLSAGAVVELGPGEHVAPSSTLGVSMTLKGAGQQQTTIKGQVRTYAARLRLVDLTVESTNYGIEATAGQLELRNVTVRSTQVSVYAYGTASLLMWNVDLGSTNGQALYATGTTVAGRIRSDGAYGFQALGDVWLSGAALHSDSNYALYLREGAGHVSNLTVSGYYGVYLDGRRRLQDVYLHTATYGLSCSSVAGEVLGVMVGLDVNTANNGCTAMGMAYDAVSVTNGVPGASSLAWDGGNPFLTDPDGTRRDVGATGGRAGILTEHGLQDPDADVDGDGLPAVYEYILGSSDELGDSDGDGVGDRQELYGGGDPADASDKLPTTKVTTWRGSVGQELSIKPAWTSDPQGDPCVFSWDDGESAGTRAVDTSTSGSWIWPWSLKCGTGTLHEVATVLVEELVYVPGDVSTLQEALEAAEPHHRIVLQEGDWSASGSFTGVALQGTDGTVIEGDLAMTGPAQLSDVLVVGSLQLERGGMNRVRVFGAVDLDRASGRNVLVDQGDLRIWGGGTFANLTVDGGLSGPTEGIRSSVATGVVSIPWDAVDTGNRWGGAVSALDFIRKVEDPWLSVLEPWPGSTLWDSGSQQEVNQDLDGSREDIGHTGGPEAWVRDADLDGMADVWEALHEVDEPDEDLDQDGLTNAQEWVLNTDPRDADTDDDRLFDGEDPDPLVPGVHGLFLELMVDDRVVRPRQPVQATLAVDDPAGMAWSVQWSLEPPPGSEATGNGTDPFRFVPDVPGAYVVTADFETADGYTETVQVVVWGRREQLVPAGTNLELAVASAEPGTALILEGSFPFSGNLVVDRDLLITQQEGALVGGIEGLIGAPAIIVSNGATLVLEGVTLKPGDRETGIQIIEGSSLEMRQARIVGGFYALWLEDGSADIVASQIVAAESLMYAYLSSVSIRNSVVGYPPDEDWEAYSWYMTESSLVVRGSVVDFRPAPFGMSCGWNCQLSLDHSLIVDHVGVEQWMDSMVEEGDPGFLFSPLDAGSRVGDLRLNVLSPLIDAGPDGDPDRDGSPNDVGSFGGRWGDWIDVDNDRDGWTNLEGDCDDFDASVHPDWYTGECPQAEPGCSSSSSEGSSRAGLVALCLVALLARRRERAG